MDTGSKTAWGLTDGSAGMVAQVRSLAAALGIDCVMKNANIKDPFSYLPNEFYNFFPKRFVVPFLMADQNSALDAPYPDMVISCGRRASVIAAGLRYKLQHQSGENKTKFINIQDPHIRHDNFDLIVAMAHDGITGDNVLKTQYALHVITPKLLEDAREKFLPRFAHYPMPVAAVLLGGSTNKYTLTTEGMSKVVMALQRLIGQTTASVFITPSRRTGEVNASMLQALTGKYSERVYVYDGKEENPYMGMLALAEYIIVTNDSVNMMSEAVATGKPIYILPLPGHKDTKPARFAERLIREGIARPIANKLENWSYQVPEEMATLTGEIRQRLELP